MQLLAGFCAVGILSIPPHIEEVIYRRRKYRLHENPPFLRVFTLHQVTVVNGDEVFAT
jgi:hypothetical protein